MANTTSSSTPLPPVCHDSTPYLAQQDSQLTIFNLYPKYVDLDTDYKIAGICKGLEEHAIDGVTGCRRPNKK